MRVDFKNMPDNSRIWIYQSDRDLNESEISIIDDKTTTFLDSWQAHGKDLECLGANKENQCTFREVWRWQRHAPYDVGAF